MKLNALWATVFALLLTLNSEFSVGHAQGTAFTYQGRLSSGTTGVTGLYDFRFAAYDAASGGNQIGSTVNLTGVGVTNGLVTVTLDFGANVFTGAARYLDLATRTNGSVAAFVSMTPRQPLTPAPYAVYAASANAVASGAVGNAQISASAVQQTNLIVAGTPGAGKIISSDGNGLVWANAPTASGAWGLTGNSGETPGVNFLGTTDNQPLEFRANNVRGLRIESGNISAKAIATGLPFPNGAPSVIGGSPNNFIGPNVVGAFIGGGGATNFINNAYTNSILSDFGVIGGGAVNSIGSMDTSLGGTGSVIGGGGGNTIQHNAQGSVIGGGGANTVGLNAYYSVIVGGRNHQVAGVCSFIGGGGYDGQTYAGNFIAGNASSIVGGVGNSILLNGVEAFIGGGNFNTINGLAGTIGGGTYNTNNGNIGTIAGGQNNTITGNYQPSIGGGYGNTASGNYATVPGGYGNVASNDFSFAAGHFAKATNSGAFVWADNQGTDFGSTANNQFNVRAQGGARFVTGGAGVTVDGNTVLTTSSGTNGVTIQQNVAGSPSVILGSSVNQAASGVSGATVGGGGSSAAHYTNSATADFATVSGGAQNTASGAFSVVSGGQNNKAAQNYSAILGGQNNTASGLNSAVLNGIFNNASGDYSLAAGANATASGTFAVILGGQHNTASGQSSVVLGGDYNTATGTYSLAAGEHAHAVNNGAFVWADTQGSDLYSTVNDQFLVRARGGVVFDNTPETLGSAVNVLGGFSVNGTTRLQSANTVTLTNFGVFKNTGDANIGGALAVNSSAGNLTMQGESGVAMAIAATGGPNSGHVRFRNALEIFPASDASAPGTLDVRNTNGFATVTLRGDTGSISATNISTVGNATIGGNLSANNTPGVNYDQSTSDNITVTTSVTGICSEGNAKPATGFFIITGYIYGNFNGNIVILNLVDVTGAPQVLTFVRSDAATGFETLNLNWVVPITVANGYQNFALQAKTVSGTANISSHSLTVLYVPRQNN